VGSDLKLPGKGREGKERDRKKAERGRGERGGMGIDKVLDIYATA